jgi:HPt (histidine-containing phosphotransfer) domain-containing protein
MITKSTQIDNFKRIFEEMKLEFGAKYHDDMRTISMRVISAEIVRLETAMQNNDLPVIKKVAHKLIGSCTSLNLTQGMEISRKIERDATEGKNTKKDQGHFLAYLKCYIQFIEND